MRSGPLHFKKDLNRNLPVGSAFNKGWKLFCCFLLTLLTVFSGSVKVQAEGTPSVMPTIANGTGIYISPTTASGPYRGSAVESRIEFFITDHNTQNLYFNFKAYNRNTTPVQTAIYYRILDVNTNTVQAGPTLVSTGSQISTYAQAMAGPNIGGLTPAGYTPLFFNPSVNGHYYVELYASSDGGLTTNTTNIILTLFDFTVATAANVQFPGRLHSKAWSFITYDPTTNAGALANSLVGDFYSYTADSTVVNVNFTSGFRPFGFVLYMNKYGAVNGTNWMSDRRSQNTGAVQPSLPNGYDVFLESPDVGEFPIAATASAPVFAGKVYGCSPNVYVPYSIDKAGDVVILLDINGSPGFQAGTSDRYIYFINSVVGRNVGIWDGLDGLGNVVSTTVPFNMTLSLRRGRVNIPMYDAELNTNGMTVTGVSPLATVPRLFFDDALLANTASTTCANATTDANNNNTGAGISNVDIGLPSPGRAWDGPGSGNATPALPAGGGSSTLPFNCDDWGNVRTLNTWFWAYEVSSAIYSVTVPACSADGDPISYTTDIDDDNDGLTDIVEGGGTDPFADADLDGIPNALDITPGGAVPAFVDVNNDGVNDNYDTDLDGVVNSFDLDSDNDGIPDLIEAGGVDTNGNGRIDGTTDVNFNGLIDTYDPLAGGITLANRDTDGDGVPNVRDLDSDNDGIPDILEVLGTDADNNGMADVLTDSDNDGFVNAYDPDDNNDGVNEGPADSRIITGADTNADGLADSYTRGDFDLDNKPNPYDLDADGDGILDVREAGLPDATNDGLADGTRGADGWSDTVDALPGPLALTNTDGVTNPNYLDIDADNDGIVDIIEAQTTAGYLAPLGTDTDNDGIDNRYDNATGTFGGNANNGLTPVNTDGTDNPDYTDTDSDNDRKPDYVEGWDTSGNGSINGAEKAGGVADIDGDGLLDGYDINTAAVNPTNGTTPASYPDVNNPGGDRDWRQAQDTDGDGIADAIDIDDDNDGVIDTQENSLGLDPLADADADGIPNYLDTSNAGYVDTNGDGIDDRYDTDLDGIVNSRDLDTDNDGIPDLAEAGGVDTNGDGRADVLTDANNNGLADFYETAQGGHTLANRDTDGDGVPNARDLDSDNDGIPDILEVGGTDADNNGMVDVLADTDGDGLVNAYDPDDDNNLVIEGPADSRIITGADGNNDGLPDTYTRGDFDGDTKPNPYDLDADGDGILDVREAGLPDATNDGIADGTLGADGWSDTVDALAGPLALTNTDTNGNPNYLDIDADNDGIVDNIEGQTTAAYQAPLLIDSDGDGIDNRYDNNNAAFAGNANNGITPANTDGTDNPDYTDLDADNDGKPDTLEGWDTNGNGSINGAEKTGGVADIDGDGLLDGYDNNTAAVNPTNGTTPASYPDVNNPGGDRDWRQAGNSDNDAIADNIDLDDDNDGIPDLQESVTGLDPLADADADGIPNYLDPTNAGYVDTNGDGIDDRYDTDLDGVINSVDLDSDNDGIPDLIEAGGVDTNGDGRVDVLTDANNNGLADFYETAQGGHALVNRDTDGDGVPNTRDLDSDNDGIPDIVEVGGTDADNNGIADVLTDSDGDGFVNAYDPDDNNDGTNESPADSRIITGADTNNDGLADSFTRGDFDGDAKPNPYDLDADGDGILDVREAGLPDATNDGLADGTRGADGWSDTVDALAGPLVLTNTDGITNPNYLDIDSDNDGIVDNIEGQTTAAYLAPLGTDTDGDGIDNRYDNLPGTFGGNANNGITPANTDGTDNPDYTDLNSDNDAKSDAIEGWDTNGNGVISGAEKTGGLADIDGDGLLDGYDNNTAAVNPTNGTTPASYPDVNNPGGDRDWRQAADTDRDGIVDTIDLDDDNDGVPDTQESSTGLDPLADANANGIPNYIDPANAGFVDTNGDGIDDRYDTDLDGVINSFDLDTDNDGIPDIIEAGGVDIDGNGRVDGVSDGNSNGLIDTYDPAVGGNALGNRDTDGDGIPNTRDLDSDNDGIPDIVEARGADADNNGMVDALADTDGDGFVNAYDPDDDNNGVNESPNDPLIVTGADTNADGKADSYARGDFDKDGKPNPYDLDADGDGILDVREAGLPDATNDGIADGTLGADGWSDTVDALATLTQINTDGVTNPDYLDIDADNDGIVDNIEGQSTIAYIAPSGIDTDNDGIDNSYDNNPAVFGGNANNGITPVNTDGADNPDYIDLNSDNDTRTDAIEGWDTNGNGIINGAEKTGGVADIDADGLLDGYDNNTAAVNPTNGTTPASYPDVVNPGGDRDWRQANDNDNDGVPDLVDADDDNDGIPDAQESPVGLNPLNDADGDGIPNYMDPSNAGYVDTNGDGIDDRYDTDLDGVINSFDLDSDQDGIPDIVEAGGVDMNGDGRVDGVFSDADGDGLATTYDPNNGGVAIANLDTDGDGIPNMRDTDSDNDGIPDVREAGGTDTNNDGKIDGFTDTDGDGLADSVDGDVGNDGTAENTANALIPTGADTNGDGRPNSYPKANKDANGLPNPYDLDSDGDGILDVTEAGLPDSNKDGVVDGTLDADGWSNDVDALPTLTLTNSDGDIYPDFLDIDADNDGITDNIEGQPTATYTLPTGVDTDGDGIDDAYDNNDAGFAGAANNGIIPWNHAGSVDALPDYIDTDTDDDGALDIVEAHDYNLNHKPDDLVTLTGVDSDGDGLDDRFDLVVGPNVTEEGMLTNGAVGNPATPGARGPLQKGAPADVDRQWRNVLSILPIRLLSFTAQSRPGNSVQLNWIAENEVDFKEYVLERSTDGINFSAIATVAGIGGNRSVYAYTDNLGSQLVTKLYYRLKPVDIDGRFTYSRILFVTLDQISGITLLVTPNPASSNVALKIVSDKQRTALVNIIDNQGRILSAQRISITNGNNIITLTDANRLISGIYTVLVNTGEEKLSAKLVIQR